MIEEKNHRNIERYPEIQKNGREQLLKLVTKSFYNELINYGIRSKDIVTVSVNLLDLVTDKEKVSNKNGTYYNKQFTIEAVNENWQKRKTLSMKEVSISPLVPQAVKTISGWLKENGVKDTFIDFFPKREPELARYFFEDENRLYFSINYQDEFVGIIGADHLNHADHSLEMKKYVGAPGFGGKGIGKRATFLFLYYAFLILKYNKVFIHSLDTNIRNINLNSKFGFELEGIFFQDIQRNNDYLDVVRMGLLRNSWLKIFSH